MERLVLAFMQTTHQNIITESSVFIEIIITIIISMVEQLHEAAEPRA